MRTESVGYGLGLSTTKAPLPSWLLHDAMHAAIARENTVEAADDVCLPLIGIPGSGVFLMLASVVPSKLGSRKPLQMIIALSESCI